MPQFSLPDSSQEHVIQVPCWSILTPLRGGPGGQWQRRLPVGINLNGINGFSVSKFLGKIVTNVDLYKFVVETNGLAVLI